MRVFVDTNLWAYRLDRREPLSWFDALFVEAAIRSGCTCLYTEDFGHDQHFGALKVRNPFLIT